MNRPLATTLIQGPSAWNPLSVPSTLSVGDITDLAYLVSLENSAVMTFYSMQYSSQKDSVSPLTLTVSVHAVFGRMTI
ncbi:hypothetical protein GNI_100650 [Gregarina niphandrodes]|uniref:Uncharacterized protein n=1 Tax=Gregarina niphandrodes TaxID=110365 RepID=A0A023B4V6_GRENI|nr:hypothetical protein GNI_100650 [Gregarina niphandrodes]EZG56832.1 hypothetical protein GNI_100650 [Gregarina niphandrodes]|eukprot:XP_011131137.1 hypothetical protein GNI_100650 [Gregarina niphandrodes]